jgi:hypothetical protein
MYDLVKDDPMLSLIMTILREVGLRGGAVVHMKLSYLVTPEGLPRTECTVPEKGNKMRRFVTSKHLQTKIKVFFDQLRSKYGKSLSKDVYCFHTCDHSTPWNLQDLTQELKAIAKKADVSVNVHLHAFRHTLVGKLMSVGNTIDNVSKFMGHANSAVTSQHYWLTNVKDLATTMNNPFTGTYMNKEEEKEDYIEDNDYQRKKVATALHIIETFTSILGDCLEKDPESEGLKDFKNRVFEEIPDLAFLLKNISQSISDSTSCSTASTSRQ